MDWRTKTACPLRSSPVSSRLRMLQDLQMPMILSWPCLKDTTRWALNDQKQDALHPSSFP